MEQVISKATVLKFFQKARSMDQAHAHFRTRRYVGTNMLVCDQRRDDRFNEIFVKLEAKGFFNKTSGLVLTIKGEYAFDHPSALAEDVCA